MGKLDTTMRAYLSDPEICADFIQHFIFHNRINISPDMLHTIDSRQTFRNNRPGGDAAVRDRYSDILVTVRGQNFCLIVGIENQAEMLRIMPVRTAGYDTTHYENQIHKLTKIHRAAGDLGPADYLSGIHENEKLVPVISLVFHFGESPWTGAVSLSEMLDLNPLSPDVRQMVADYRINLIDIHTVGSTENFRTSLGTLIELMKIRKSKKAIRHYIERHPDFFSHVSSDLYNVIAALTDSEWLMKQKEKYFSEERKDYNMCTGMKEWLNDVRIEGWNKGVSEGWSKGISEGETRGFDLSCKIISDIIAGKDVSAIASEYNVDDNRVLMIVHAMKN